MKKLVIFSVLSLLAFRVADVLSDLGLTRPEAQQRVVESITAAYINVPDACRKLPLSQRAGMVGNVVDFAKAYAKTDDFRQHYTAWRMAAKPVSSAKSYEQVQQEQKVQIAEIKKSLTEAKVNMKKLDATTQKAMQQAIGQQEKMVAEMEAGTSPVLMKRETVDQINKYAEAEYQEKLTKWEENYPADPRVMIQKQLTSFLKQSDGVDFGAKLTDRDGKKYFVNPAYEQKSDAWKKCFRAGADATATARKQAQTWLAELETK